MPWKSKEVAAKKKKEYYLNNKEKMDAYYKEYNFKNRDKKIAMANTWNKNNKDRYNKKCSDWAKNNPLKRKSTYLLYSNGITLDDYNRILYDQGGCCAICKSLTPGSKKGYFCVDHCHSTNINRGLLCDSCNKWLGHFKDNTDLMKQAIEYLNAAIPVKNNFIHN